MHGEDPETRQGLGKYRDLPEKIVVRGIRTRERRNTWV
jgi:hypothetical protein